MKCRFKFEKIKELLQFANSNKTMLFKDTTFYQYLNADLANFTAKLNTSEIALFSVHEIKYLQLLSFSFSFKIFNE